MKYVLQMYVKIWFIKLVVHTFSDRFWLLIYRFFHEQIFFYEYLQHPEKYLLFTYLYYIFRQIKNRIFKR